ncbi:MAG: DUF2085 domain-containing protein, partial [Promethearchaeota archaeon]
MEENNDGVALEKNIKNPLRIIFLNLFISVFIIMFYFYLAEFFGSISTIFIENSELIISFGITLLLFTFFSTLAGKYHGFFAGFIGELLYQLAYYNEIYIYWCLIVAIWGFLSGIWKYKPLRYHNLKNLGYSGVIIFLSSLFTMFLIIIFQKILYNSHFELIIINHGLKFLINAVIVIVMVPLLLFLYDKTFATYEKHIYDLFLTHHTVSQSDHTFFLKFGRTYIYFCSRCSGVIIGGVIAFFFTHLFERIYHTEISPIIALFLCIILPIPGLIDWGTQRLTLRKSTTESRLFTGFVIGSAIHLMSFTREY